MAKKISILEKVTTLLIVISAFITVIIAFTLEEKPQTIEECIDKSDLENAYQTLTWYEANKMGFNLSIVSTDLRADEIELKLFSLSPDYLVMVYNDYKIGIIDLEKFIAFMEKDLLPVNKLSTPIWELIKMIESARIMPLEKVNKLSLTDRVYKWNEIEIVEYQDMCKIMKRLVDSQVKISDDF